MIEGVHLARFLDAYRMAVGITMTVSSTGESPDFICARPSGELVGVELARSPHEYERVIYDRVCGERNPLWGLHPQPALEQKPYG